MLLIHSLINVNVNQKCVLIEVLKKYFDDLIICGNPLN